MISKRKKLSFSVTWIVLFAVSVVVLIATPKSVLDSLTCLQGTDEFMDFFNHISYSRDLKNTYTMGFEVSFPPLAYLLYYFLGLLIPSNSTSAYLAVETKPYAYLLYGIYVSLIIALFAFAVFTYLKYKNKNFAFALVAMVLLSNTYIFGVLERGNIVMFVAAVLLISLIAKYSNNKRGNALATGSIAVAANFKLYPAVFGVLYIKDGNKRKTFNLVLWGVILFVVPFAFLGGINGFLEFFTNVATVSKYCLKPCINGVSQLVMLIAKVFGVSNLENVRYVAIAISFVYLALCIYISFCSKSMWKCLYLLTSVMVLFPSWSASYTKIYFIIPLVAFLMSKEKQSKKVEIIISVLFALIFSAVYINGTLLSNAISEWISYFGVYSILVYVFCSEIKNVIKHKDFKMNKIVE